MKTRWTQVRVTWLVAAVLLPVWGMSAAPCQAQAFADGDVSIEGTLSVVHVDEVDPVKSHYDYFVEEVKTRAMTQLLFKQPPMRPLRSGDPVRAKGRRMGKVLTVIDFAVGESTNSSTSASVAGAATAASTSHHAIVMVLNMTGSPTPYDSTTPPYDSTTLSQVSTAMFGTAYSVNTVYNEASFSQLNFPGSAANVVLLSVPFVEACEYYTIASNADAAAQQAGLDLTQYQHRVYLVPPSKISGCTWLALGQIGNYGSTAVYKSWSTRNDSLAYAHELGHNLGWQHAATDPNNDGKVDVEYGDKSDLMGYCCDKRKVNGVHSDQIGWFNSAGLAAKVVNVTSPGLYHLVPLGSDPLTTVYPQILKITPPDNSRTYYLSYRRPVGLDAGISSKYTTGVNVHRGLKADSWSYEVAVLNNDTASTFSDTVNGIAIHQLASDSTQVTIDIAFGACVKRAPTVTLSPATQLLSAAGGVVTYNVSVLNNDSIGCDQVSFALSLSSGLTGSFQSSVMALAPGSSGSASVNVQSATGMADGSYQFSVKAADQNVPSGQHEGTTTATLQVDMQAPMPPSTVTASQKKVQGRQSVQLTWPQAVDTAGGTGVATYRVSRNGTQLSQTVNTSFADNTASAGTTYTYTVHSIDHAGHQSATAASVTFTLGGGGPKGR